MAGVLVVLAPQAETKTVAVHAIVNTGARKRLLVTLLLSVPAGPVVGAVSAKRSPSQDVGGALHTPRLQPLVGLLSHIRGTTPMESLRSAILCSFAISRDAIPATAKSKARVGGIEGGNAWSE